MENMEENREKIWKIRRKNGNVGKIRSCDKIWKIQKYGKYGWKISWNVNWYGKYGRK